ncbi:NAD-dependent epimerase/dehydratase family protein (plasmid) [Roseobacteraceae bacterium NS-SX3]
MGFPATVVLGATGRIGRILRREWPALAAGADLRWQARHPQPGAGWHVFAPLEEPAALARAAEGAEVILCLAGVVNARPGGDLEDNIRLAEAAVRAGAACGARVLLASSAAVYGNQQGLLAEAAPLLPANAYGRAKAEMEALALALAADLGVSACALRIGNIAGLDAVLGGWRPGFMLDQFEDGRSSRRSYTGVQVLARVLAAVAALRDLPPHLNIAQPGPIEMADLLRAAGRGFTLRPAPDTAIPEVALDVSRLAALLPPEVPLPPADPARMAAEWAALAPDGPEGHA